MTQLGLLIKFWFISKCYSTVFLCRDVHEADQSETKTMNKPLDSDTEAFANPSETRPRP